MKTNISYNASVGEYQEDLVMACDGARPNVIQALMDKTAEFKAQGYKRTDVQYSYSASKDTEKPSRLHAFAHFVRDIDHEAIEAEKFAAHKRVIVAELREYLAEALPEFVEQFVLDIFDPLTVSVTLDTQREGESCECGINEDGACDTACIGEVDSCCEAECAYDPYEARFQDLSKRVEALETLVSSRLVVIESLTSDVRNQFAKISAQMTQVLDRLD